MTAGLAPWGLGSDTGGSIKQPSALCGNVGLRPTYGTVSRYGVVAFASSLDQVGPVAKTVRDVALLYSIIAGRDPRDSTTVELREPVRLPEDERLDGLRIGVPKQIGSLDAIEPGVRAAFEQALELAEELGADIDECDLPDSRIGTGCRATTSSRRPRRHRTSRATTAFATGRAPTPRPTTRWSSERGTRASAPSRSGGSCSARTRSRPATTTRSTGRRRRCGRSLIREHREALAHVDVIVTPTSPTVAFPIGDKAADPLAMYACDLLTIPSCLAGLPGLSIPCGLSEGLPVGLQLVGPQFGENTLFRVGHALEQAIGFDTVPPRWRLR